MMGLCPPRSPPLEVLVVEAAAWSGRAMELAVLFEDNHLLVVDKPAGLLSQGAGEGDDHLVAVAQRYLKAKYQKPGNVYVGLIHRLDRMTSGVMVLAKTSKAAERLSRSVRERRLDKRYLAVVAGLTPAHVRLEDALITGPEGSKVAPGHPEARRADLELTRLAAGRLPSGGPASLVEVKLGSGRKHQIRVQLAHHGHPLLGDRRYGHRAHDALLGRVALHAATLTLPHPVGGAPMRFEALLPRDLVQLMDRLGLARPS